MSKEFCGWGFLSTAAIARKNWKAVRLSGNGRVVAVASRDANKAQRFIDECSSEVPQEEPTDALGSYEALLERDDVDAIYIPLPTGIRKEWVIAAAQAGKHVLCEKPVAIHADDAKAMIDACNEAGVQFMDGVMFDHSQRMPGLLSSIRSEATFGDLRRIQTHFSFNAGADFEKSNIRASAVFEPHGCLGDLGWYCIRFTLWMTQGQLPQQVIAHTLQSYDDGVPCEFVAEMTFPGGVTAGFYCSFRTVNQQTALVSGSNGYLSVDDFVLPFYSPESGWAEHSHALEIDNCRWNFCERTTPQSVAEFASGEPNAQEVRMVRRLGEIALSGQCETHYPEVSLKTQRVLDACRKSAASGGQPVKL